MTSPLGQKVLDFYTSTSKQVQDIHEEARRIAEQQKASHAATSGQKETTGGPGKETTGGPEKIPNPSTQAAPTVV